LPGGAAYQATLPWDFTHRNYSVQLPNNYDPNTPYPLMVGGGGCGQAPTDPGGGFSAGGTNAIIVGLSYVKMCFADGGTSCAGTVANEPLCVNTPEVPYFKAMLADVESKFCVDQGKVFLGGYSSGAWETLTLGCALANVIRGTVSLEGGMRVNRPACTGAMAALMVVGEADTVNPVGPLATIDAMLDSYGSAPARDDLLARNGCTGTATVPYDPNYPQCVTYTGCPAAFPVVWCPLPGVGHANSNYNNVDYSPGSVPGDSLYWNFLTRLPAR
jgi:poly(3-hydroxybutyrate) depolymerase